MSRKPVILRGLAERDIEAATAYYLRDAGESVALGFIDAVESAIGAIANVPAIGSPRYGQELDFPGLRSRPVKRYPYLVFYVEGDEHIDLWRVLHAKRDIPAWLQASEEPQTDD